jgi:hypothetical protein
MMGKKRESEGTAGTIAAGLAVLVLGGVGLGWWRRRVARAHGGLCKVVEESVYRGFKIRVEKCPAGENVVYFGVLPVQQVGSVDILVDEGEFFATIDAARKYAQSLADAKLGGPQLRAVFVGSNR